MHGAVRHDLWRSDDPHRTECCHGTEVATLDVEDHRKLGALLRIRVKLAGARKIGRRVEPSWSRSLDGLGVEPRDVGRRTDCARTEKQQLRRGRKDPNLTEIECGSECGR